MINGSGMSIGNVQSQKTLGTGANENGIQQKDQELTERRSHMGETNMRAAARYHLEGAASVSKATHRKSHFRDDATLGSGPDVPILTPAEIRSNIDLLDSSAMQARQLTQGARTGMSPKSQKQRSPHVAMPGTPAEKQQPPVLPTGHQRRNTQYGNRELLAMRRTSIGADVINKAVVSGGDEADTTVLVSPRRTRVPPLSRLNRSPLGSYNKRSSGSGTPTPQEEQLREILKKKNELFVKSRGIGQFFRSTADRKGFHDLIRQGGVPGSRRDLLAAAATVTGVIPLQELRIEPSVATELGRTSAPQGSTSSMQKAEVSANGAVDFRVNAEHSRSNDHQSRGQLSTTFAENSGANRVATPGLGHLAKAMYQPEPITIADRSAAGSSHGGTRLVTKQPTPRSIERLGVINTNKGANALHPNDSSNVSTYYRGHIGEPLTATMLPGEVPNVYRVLPQQGQRQNQEGNDGGRRGTTPAGVTTSMGDSLHQSSMQYTRQSVDVIQPRQLDPQNMMRTDYFAGRAPTSPFFAKRSREQMGQTAMTGPAWQHRSEYPSVNSSVMLPEPPGGRQLFSQLFESRENNLRPHEKNQIFAAIGMSKYAGRAGAGGSTAAVSTPKRSQASSPMFGHTQSPPMNLSREIFGAFSSAQPTGRLLAASISSNQGNKDAVRDSIGSQQPSVVKRDSVNSSCVNGVLAHEPVVSTLNLRGSELAKSLKMNKDEFQKNLGAVGKENIRKIKINKLASASQFLLKSQHSSRAREHERTRSQQNQDLQLDSGANSLLHNKTGAQRKTPKATERPYKTRKPSVQKHKMPLPTVQIELEDALQSQIMSLRSYQRLKQIESPHVPTISGEQLIMRNAKPVPEQHTERTCQRAQATGPMAQPIVADEAIERILSYNRSQRNKALGSRQSHNQNADNNERANSVSTRSKISTSLNLSATKPVSHADIEKVIDQYRMKSSVVIVGSSTPNSMAGPEPVKRKPFKQAITPTHVRKAQSPDSPCSVNQKIARKMRASHNIQSTPQTPRHDTTVASHDALTKARRVSKRKKKSIPLIQSKQPAYGLPTEEGSLESGRPINIVLNTRNLSRSPTLMRAQKQKKDKKRGGKKSLDSCDQSNASDTPMFSSAVKLANELADEAQDFMISSGCAFTLDRDALQMEKDQQEAKNFKSTTSIEKGAFELTEVTDPLEEEEVATRALTPGLIQFIQHIRSVRKADTPMSRLFSSPAGDKLLEDQLQRLRGTHRRVMKSTIGCLAPWRSTQQIMADVVTLSARSRDKQPFAMKPYEPRFITIENLKNRQEPIRLHLSGIPPKADVHVLISTNCQFPTEQSCHGKFVNKREIEFSTSPATSRNTDDRVTPRFKESHLYISIESSEKAAEALVTMSFGAKSAFDLFRAEKSAGAALLASFAQGLQKRVMMMQMGAKTMDGSDRVLANVQKTLEGSYRNPLEYFTAVTREITKLLEEEPAAMKFVRRTEELRRQVELQKRGVRRESLSRRNVIRSNTQGAKLFVVSDFKRRMELKITKDKRLEESVDKRESKESADRQAAIEFLHRNFLQNIRSKLMNHKVMSQARQQECVRRTISLVALQKILYIVHEKYRERRICYHQRLRMYFAARKLQINFRKRLCPNDPVDSQLLQPQSTARRIEMHFRSAAVFAVIATHELAKERAADLLVRFINSVKLCDDFNEMVERFNIRRLSLLRQRAITVEDLHAEAYMSPLRAYRVHKEISDLCYRELSEVDYPCIMVALGPVKYALACAIYRSKSLLQFFQLVKGPDNDLHEVMSPRSHSSTDTLSSLIFRPSHRVYRESIENLRLRGFNCANFDLISLYRRHVQKHAIELTVKLAVAGVNPAVIKLIDELTNNKYYHAMFLSLK